MESKKIPDDETSGNHLNEIDVNHLLYLASMLCESIEDLRTELLTSHPCELTRRIYRLETWHRLLSLAQRFEEVVLIDKPRG